jgi:hypothetical protein
MPPYLAGRETEKDEFAKLLEQETILENLILTGLRGVGKTVLLDTFRPIAVQGSWLWIGTDLSESASVSEEKIAVRLLTDLAVVTSATSIGKRTLPQAGFAPPEKYVDLKLTYEVLQQVYANTPGLAADKLKAVLELAWLCLSPHGHRGIVFAYDEAQNLSDHAVKEQFPLSLLLDVFQSLQRRGMPLMLVLTGLPTLFPKLVEARTFAERMFHVLFLRRLNDEDSRAAILKPIEAADCPVTFKEDSVSTIVRISGGYPYFIQFICREAYDVWIQKNDAGEHMGVPANEILRKLDVDFFQGRWARATDRQRQLLTIVALVLADKDSQEFTVQEVVERSKEGEKPFSSSHVNQMLSSLGHSGLVYKDRHGRYLFAVPLLDQFILRQVSETLPAPLG